MSKQTNPPSYVPPAHFVAWLEAEPGRAEYFSRIDKGLYPAQVSKMKSGRIPITFAYAVRLVRAQKPSDTPLTAEALMTFQEDRALYRFVTGQEPAPAPVEVTHKPRNTKIQRLTIAEA